MGRGEEEEELPSLHFVVPDGIIMGMDEEGHLLWQQKVSLWECSGRSSDPSLDFGLD